MPSRAVAESQRAGSHPRVLPLWSRLGAALCLGALSACEPVKELEEPQELLSTRRQKLDDLNGLAFNGLAFNGLAFNGLAFNGLAFNGLSAETFSTWFQTDPASNDMMMKYIVRCAVPEGQERTYTDAVTGHTYRWTGGLGLAPDWAEGAPASLDEQQLISACLAALSNKYGVHVPISVLGRTAQGEPIPYDKEELSEFKEKEACFFGNLFTGEGVFVGNDGPKLHHSDSSARACARSDEKDDDRQPCKPLMRVRLKCNKFCEEDESKKFYSQCTYNGITYRPLTTRMRKKEIFKCGDGICQVSESCGTGGTPDNCGKDCGPCE